MLDLRKRLFIIISVVIGIILVFILFYLFQKREPVVVDVLPDTIVDEGEPVVDLNQTRAVQQEVVVPPLTEDMGERYVRQVSRIFVERFASESTQNDNRHIDDVLPMVMPAMAAWLETQREVNTREYEGVSTQVIASQLQEMDESTAIVIVNTQQIKESMDEQEITQKDGRVELVKVNGEWKIDGFYWDKTE
ncbi:hypothetical protein KKG22_02465 [Patescibacteria group bacterium]|nr:hypothetical protein [Patescibacteria group bacterium]MBU1722165.1 hypothetical protein [Patescibacteria group bacterium]MBU1901116.1 hypothetical protein [Patescibacteria group bacterium]